MKNVLLLAHDDPGQESRLQAALDVVRALEGHLHCLDVTRAVALGGYFAITAEGALMEEEREREIANEERLRERLTEEDVPWTVTSACGEFEDSIRKASGLADLIVLSRQLDSPGSPDMLGSLSAILHNVHRPVLAVPEQCRGFEASGRAVVAWDGSMPAMSALTASVPLLRLAQSVNIVEIQGSSNGSVDDAATYLSRHGIHAEVDLVARFKDDESDLGTVVRDLCRRRSAAYCVMGAYGHSRLREALFGGVSRHMLTRSEIPLFLAH